MARKSNSKDIYSNLKGWEKKYISNSIKYGKLDKKKPTYNSNESKEK